MPCLDGHCIVTCVNGSLRSRVVRFWGPSGSVLFFFSIGFVITFLYSLKTNYWFYSDRNLSFRKGTETLLVPSSSCPPKISWVSVWALNAKTKRRKEIHRGCNTISLAVEPQLTVPIGMNVVGGYQREKEREREGFGVSFNKYQITQRGWNTVTGGLFNYFFFLCNFCFRYFNFLFLNQKQRLIVISFSLSFGAGTR